MEIPTEVITGIASSFVVLAGGAVYVNKKLVNGLMNTIMVSLKDIKKILEEKL